MFLKVIFKAAKGTSDRTAHYRLVESYRYDTCVKHETMLHLGTLPELTDVDQKKELAYRINELVKEHRTGKHSLFVPIDGTVEKLAQKFFIELKQKQKIDIDKQKDIHRVDLDSVKNKDVREIGIEWLCKQALDQLKLSDVLKANDWDDQKIQLAYTHIISRASYPASEYKTTKWIQENSSVCELTGYPIENITKDKLYTISNDLYTLKDKLESHLSTTTNELFDLHDKIILYDLTNTYFEGSMRKSKIAKFGRSKEKRTDARLVVLAVVVNVEGFLKYSQIFEGNLSDSKSLEKIIDELVKRTEQAEPKPIVVLDAGIATERNLELLKQKGYDYMCVSRSGIQKYTIDTACERIEVKDNRQHPIYLQKVKMEEVSDTFLLVQSEYKALKESGMNSLFSQRFEDGLVNIQASLEKKSGVKKRDKVWERIGRLKQKYPTIQRHYEIETKVNEKEIVTALTWTQKQIDRKEGLYLLRTTLNEKDEKTQWKIYNTIREIEATFRTLKNDLDLRPIYHKTDVATMAHLHLGLLAYWIVSTVRYQLKQQNIKDEWREIIRTMNTQKAVTTTMQDEYELDIIIRQCSEPTEKALAIYNALKYKSKPFSRKKSVVPQNKFSKNETQAQCNFSSA